MYTPEQFERLQAWAARAESGAAMEHLWSPGEATFLQRYTSTTTNTVRHGCACPDPWRNGRKKKYFLGVSCRVTERGCTN